MWLALICFHLVGLVGFNLLMRNSVLQNIDRLTLATIAQIGIAIPAVILLILYPPALTDFSAYEYILLAIAIALVIALQIANVTALKYLEASVYSVLYNLRIILTTALGVMFLQEDFVWLRFLGGVLILLAIFIVKQQSSKEVRIKGILWGITAATVLSVLNLTEKALIINIGFLGYFPVVAVVSALLMIAYLKLTKRPLGMEQLRQPRMLQIMTLRAVSAYGFSGALAAGALISVANYISGMSVIFTVLFGVLFLNEKDYLWRKVWATIVAVGGLTLIFVSGI